MQPSAIRMLAVTVSALCVLACGRTPSESKAASSSTGSTDSKKACELLTADDIRSVLGKSPGTSKFESNQCIWPSADGSEQFLVQLLVTPASLRSYDELAESYQRQMQSDPDQAMRPIKGVGLFAVELIDMPMVQIYTGSSMVQVATFGNKQEHALELAKKALARLE